MTRQEIQAFFAPGYPVFFGGMLYAVPASEWLTGACYAAFKARYWSDGIGAWTVRWECRDFARAFACFAQECNALATNTPDGDDACSVGEFWYHPDANAMGGDHAINACITELGLTFFEPQTGKIVTLSPNEITSCRFCRF